jgi:hypothetical protein
VNELSDFQWLASAPAAEAWSFCSRLDVFSNASFSKFGLTQRQLQVLKTQFEFAQGASKRKVADPWNWFWTKTLLEQASDQITAEETAKDFPTDSMVIDGCCGAGVDAVAIATHLSQELTLGERLLAIDSSEIACTLTQLNASRNGIDLRPVAIGFEDAELPTDGWLHLDPDRRVSGRTIDVHCTEPSWRAIAKEIQRAPGASIKAAPGFQPDDDYPWEDCGPPDSRRWISRDGSVRQQRLYWRIPKWNDAKRIVSAYRKSNGWHHEVFDSGPTSALAALDLIEQDPLQADKWTFVADHDPALRAANCVVSLSERLQLRMLGNEYGYCVGESFVENPLLRWYRVLEVMPMDHKKVRAMSRILKVGRWELKSRNIDIDLISWGKQLTVDKDSDVVGWLLLTKVGKKHVCLVCQEIQQ